MNTVRKSPPQVYSPQHKNGQQTGQRQSQWSGVAQPKQAASMQANRTPAAPPVYRPQTVPKVLQTKSAIAHQPAGRTGVAPTANAHAHTHTPAVYQPKAMSGWQPQGAQSRREAATACRPGQVCVVQPKSVLQPQKTPTPPPVYRPEPKRIMQSGAATPGAVNRVGVLQRLKLKGPASGWQKPNAVAPANVIQRHHKMRLDDTMEADAEIYIITTDMSANKAKDADDDEVVYVGQTCAQVGLDKRFDQHLKEHLSWSRQTHQPLLRENLKECTQLEVTAAERYWYDHYKLQGSPLENAIVPITKDTFLYYKTKKTFRGAEKGFPNGNSWTPKD